MNTPKFYLSHVVKSAAFGAETLEGEFLFFCIEVISCIDSDKKSIIYIEGDQKKYFNCPDSESFKTTIKNILKKYKPFPPEILYIDKAYDVDFSYCVIGNFLKGEKDLQQKINEYNLKKDSE